MRVAHQYEHHSLLKFSVIRIMKIFIFLAALVCVAHSEFFEATSTKDIFERVWEKDGVRIVTFGYAR
jgi:hypothetical protein